MDSKKGLSLEIKSMVSGLEFSADSILHSFASRLSADASFIENIYFKASLLAKAGSELDVSSFQQGIKEVHALLIQLMDRWKETATITLYHLAQLAGESKEMQGRDLFTLQSAKTQKEERHRGQKWDCGHAAEIGGLRKRLKDAEGLLEVSTTSNVLLRKYLSYLENPDDPDTNAWWDSLRETNDQDQIPNNDDGSGLDKIARAEHEKIARLLRRSSSHRNSQEDVSNTEETKKPSLQGSEFGLWDQFPTINKKLQNIFNSQKDDQHRKPVSPPETPLRQRLANKHRGNSSATLVTDLDMVDLKSLDLNDLDTMDDEWEDVSLLTKGNKTVKAFEGKDHASKLKRSKEKKEESNLYSQELDETALHVLKKVANFFKKEQINLKRLEKEESWQLLSPDAFSDMMKSLGMEISLLETLALCGYLATSAHGGMVPLSTLIERIKHQDLSENALVIQTDLETFKKRDPDLQSPYHLKHAAPRISRENTGSYILNSFDSTPPQNVEANVGDGLGIPQEVVDIFGMVAVCIKQYDMSLDSVLRQIDFYGDGAISVNDMTAALQKFGLHISNAEGYLVGKHLSLLRQDGLVLLSDLKEAILKQVNSLDLNIPLQPTDNRER